MAFEYSAASSMHDLLDKLRLFLIADGWTVNQWASDSQMYRTWSGLTATGSKRLHVQKALGPSGDTVDVYANFRSAERLVLFGSGYGTNLQIGGRYYSEVRGIGMNVSTGYDGSSAGSNWDLQPGSPRDAANGGMGCCMTEISLSGSFYYWFFSTQSTVWVSVEIQTGVFQHMCFGLLNKCGSYTGGQFYSAVCGCARPSYHYWATLSGNWRYYKNNIFEGPIESNSYKFGGSAWYGDLDSVVDWRHILYEGETTGDYGFRVYPMVNGPANSSHGATARHSFAAFVPHATLNDFNGLSVMVPIYWFVKNDAGRYRYAGLVDGVRHMNISQYEPGESFQLGDSGSEIWYPFPTLTKLDPDPIATGDTVTRKDTGFAILRED